MPEFSLPITHERGSVYTKKIFDSRETANAKETSYIPSNRFVEIVNVSHMGERPGSPNTYRLQILPLENGGFRSKQFVTDVEDDVFIIASRNELLALAHSIIDFVEDMEPSDAQPSTAPIADTDFDYDPSDMDE